MNPVSIYLQLSNYDSEENECFQMSLPCWVFSVSFSSSLLFFPHTEVMKKVFSYVLWGFLLLLLYWRFLFLEDKLVCEVSFSVFTSFLVTSIGG